MGVPSKLIKNVDEEGLDHSFHAVYVRPDDLTDPPTATTFSRTWMHHRFGSVDAELGIYRPWPRSASTSRALAPKCPPGIHYYERRLAMRASGGCCSATKICTTYRDLLVIERTYFRPRTRNLQYCGPQDSALLFSPSRCGRVLVPRKATSPRYPKRCGGSIDSRGQHDNVSERRLLIMNGGCRS